MTKTCFTYHNRVSHAVFTDHDWGCASMWAYVHSSCHGRTTQTKHSDQTISTLQATPRYVPQLHLSII